MHPDCDHVHPACSCVHQERVLAQCRGRGEGAGRGCGEGAGRGCRARLILLGSLVVVTLRSEVARRRRAVAPGLCAVSHAHAQTLELLLEAVGL
eukprot:scaffold66173_cov60-Phaeocystis_antarctica.AAC.1